MAKRNPSLVVYNPPLGRAMAIEGTVNGTMSKKVYEIKYRHDDDNQDYFHEFGSGVEMIAVESSTGEKQILLRHTNGKPLWEDFD